MLARRTRSWRAGKATAVRHLYMAMEPVTQVDLAAHAGVSQPVVLQYLSSLRANGDVSFEDPGWLATRAQLSDSHWQGYASRFATQSCWYRIDSLAAQVVVSGDVAADAVLPWKVPVVAIVYGTVGDELMDQLRFVRSDSAAAATILVRPVPDDSFRRDAIVARGMNVAPHLHLVADLTGLSGDDRLEGARRFDELGR
jgi:hypothetical protein